METDQKLGLLTGVAAVLVVAVVYFNKPSQPPGGDRVSIVAAERTAVGVPDRTYWRANTAGRDDD